MRKGKGPKRSYWPAFPYTSFTGMTDADLRDVWAYLKTLTPSSTPSRDHEVKGRYRPWKGLWRTLYFSAKRWKPDRKASEAVNRGAYLGQTVGHCGECHTPRNGVGKPRKRWTHAGSRAEPEPSPNITPHADGLDGWRADDLVTFFEMGMLPDGDFVGGAMSDICDATATLSPEDRQALAAWVLSIEARPKR